MNSNKFAITQEAAAKREELQRFLVNGGAWQCCLNCEHWTDKDRLCNLFKATPPDIIVVTGCRDHSEIIPF